MTWLPTLRDPLFPWYCYDVRGEVMAAVYLHDLDDWAWLVDRVQCWLAHVPQATRDEYAIFMAERCGHSPADLEISERLALMAGRMRALVDGAPDGAPA